MRPFDFKVTTFYHGIEGWFIYQERYFQTMKEARQYAEDLEAIHVEGFPKDKYKIEVVEAR